MISSAIAFGFERFHPSPSGLTARVTARMRGWPRSEFLRIRPIFESNRTSDSDGYAGEAAT